jgi:hypothetical protein
VATKGRREQVNGHEITPFALGFMVVSMTSVTVLVVYCYARILRGGRQLHREADD